jgi:hypothetical protein
MLDQKDRQKALEVAIAGVEKEFGKGAIMRLQDGQKLHPDVPVVPTGSIGLDVAERRRWRCMRSRVCRRRVVWRRSSTRSTRWM